MALSRVFIANRGEIALRVIRACRTLGISPIAAVSEADRESLPARMADSAVVIGPAAPTESYLNLGAVIDAATKSGADALHPGYGFLAESAELAAACRDAGIKFVGPTAETIEAMGNKLAARESATALDVPVVPGSLRISSLEAAQSLAQEVGFPVLLKAAAGGGGRGIKIVHSAAQLADAYREASGEARGAFGDDTLFMERYIGNARHIEVQILGDGKGGVIHAGERDCSLQRRYQKVVEEAPAICLTPELTTEIRDAALTLAGDINYENAGTVEFIVDQDSGRFYFLEMNTRIQVEHPVTEMVTGLDLVAEQLRIAGGAPISVSQDDIRITGHSIECRITAESPENDFQPSPGHIDTWQPPVGDGIRVDSHCENGTDVPPYYDSLLAKLIVAAPSRWQAVARMQGALNNFQVDGIETTIPFLRALTCRLDYVRGTVNTRWLEDNLAALGEAA